MSGSEKGGTETLGKKNQEKEVQMKERQGKKTKRAKEEEDYRRYPLWDNYRAAFSKFRKAMGVRYLAVVGGKIGISVLRPFAAMALPSAVVYLLGSGWQPEIMFLALAGYVLALQIMGTAGDYLGNVSRKGRFMFRIGLGAELFEAALSADFEKFESTRGQQKLEGGVCTCSLERVVNKNDKNSDRNLEGQTNGCKS